MSKINWDTTGSRFYESGIDRGVFYTSDGEPTAWNGLTSVTENNSVVNEFVSFVDGYRYMNKIESNEYSSTITAFTYPDIFAEYIGFGEFGETYKEPKLFNLTYRTKVGNDISGIDYGYRIHLIYNAKAIQESNEYVSYGSTIVPTDFSWKIETVPVDIKGLKPSSHIIIDSNKTNPIVLSLIEDILYGTETTNGYFPTVEEIMNIFQENSTFKIIDHGDGSFTAIGNDTDVTLLDSTTFQLSSESIYIIDEETYTASSR